MTTGAGNNAAVPPVEVVPATGSGAATARNAGDESWRDIRADESLQFAPVQPQAPDPPPAWLQNLFDLLGELFAPVGQTIVNLWPALKWVLLALAISLVLWLVWRLVAPLIGVSADDAEADDAWTPQREDVLALLSEADRLAAEGHYDEAAHLLLKRSVGQIAAARPDWLEPSSTAREIAALAALPDNARHAFATIARQVEHSLFALRRLSAEDWQIARAAYADFALERL
ncbi:hypothetical protein [Altererythrobacter aquiaggeris]|uniref:hypothetical protein n=1 Tax=Aestuarierythrobacter aquiaggeris TaxID=1898396 RepID=UPI0030184204